MDLEVVVLGHDSEGLGLHVLWRLGAGVRILRLAGLKGVQVG